VREARLPRSSRGRLSEAAVWVTAGSVGAAFCLWAFFLEPILGLDDLGLFNPAYAFAYLHHLAYPSYGFFDAMFVHPPTHYVLMGILLRAGAPLHLSYSLPALAILLVAIGFIATGRWSATTRVSLLLGLLLGPLLLAISISIGMGEDAFGFRIRPDLHATAAWIAGLAALESGRLAGWRRGHLAAGSFLLCYAATVHYVWITSPLTIGIYFLWAYRWAPAVRRRSALAALLAGALLFSLPYAALYLFSNLKAAITFIASAQPVGGPADAISRQSIIVQRLAERLIVQPRIAWILAPFRHGLLPILFFGPVLAWRRDTRGLLAAALPFLLFIDFGVTRKWAYYLGPELILSVTALLIIPLAAVERLSRSHRHLRALAPTCGALAGLVLVWGATPLLSSVESAPWYRGNEMKIGRRAGQAMLGTNSLVGTRIARFYTSGAAYSYMIEPDLLWNSQPPEDLPSYFSRFDAFQEDAFGASRTLNKTRDTLSTWYLAGLLQLRGAYLSSRHPDLSYVLYASSAQSPRRIFGRFRNGAVADFTEDPAGPYLFRALTCAPGSAGGRSAAVFEMAIPLPKQGRSEGRKLVLRIDGLGQPAAKTACQPHEAFRLRLIRRNTAEFLKGLENTPPIHFYRTLREAEEARLQRGESDRGGPS